MQQYLKSDTRETPLSNNLFVKQFPPGLVSSDADLQALFSPFGEIANALVMKNQQGESLGFGFVCFKDGHSA